MRRLLDTSVLVALGLCGLLAACAAAAETTPDTAAKKLNVAVITGGHPFDEQGFLKLFQSYDKITWKHLPQKTGGEVFDDIAEWPYDVIVLYNFGQSVTPKQQENFLKLLDKGVGLVVLHHAIGAYPAWPLYREISGGAWNFGPWKQNGTAMAPSHGMHNVTYKIHLSDPDHPVTRGLADFELTDELYCYLSMNPDVHALLTTNVNEFDDNDTKTIGWVKTYRNSKVAFVQPGHSTTAYENHNYRALLLRAIRWTGGQLR